MIPCIHPTFKPRKAVNSESPASQQSSTEWAIASSLRQKNNTDKTTGHTQHKFIKCNNRRIPLTPKKRKPFLSKTNAQLL